MSLDLKKGFFSPKQSLRRQRQGVADVEALDLFEAQHVVDEIGEFDESVVTLKAEAALP